MNIDFGALTRINSNLQLRGLKEADAGDKAANEQAVQKFLEANRQELINLSQATIKTEGETDAATIEWMNKLIRLAETLTAKFGNNIVNRLDNPDNGVTGALVKHDGGSMSLNLHEWKFTGATTGRLVDQFLMFTVDRCGDREMSINLTGCPKDKNINSSRTLKVNLKPRQTITADDIKLSFADVPLDQTFAGLA